QVWPSWPRAVSTFLVGLAIWYTGASSLGSFAFHSAANTERLVRADVMATHPEAYPPNTRIFIINQPFLAAELAPSLRLATDPADLEVYPLTFAPQPFYPGSDPIVEQEDERTLLVRTQGPPMFCGDFGNLIQLGWYGAKRGDLHPGAFTPAPVA